MKTDDLNESKYTRAVHHLCIENNEKQMNKTYSPTKNRCLNNLNININLNTHNLNNTYNTLIITENKQNSPTKPFKFTNNNAHPVPIGFHQQIMRTAVMWNRKQGIQAGIQNMAQTWYQTDFTSTEKGDKEQEIINQSPHTTNIYDNNHEHRKRLVTFDIENIKYGQLSKNQSPIKQSQHIKSPPVCKKMNILFDLPDVDTEPQKIDEIDKTIELNT